MPRSIQPHNRYISGARADPYASAAAARHTALGALALLNRSLDDDDSTPEDPSPAPPSNPAGHTLGLLDLPRELRDRVYDSLMPDVQKVVIKPTGRIVSAVAHPLECTSQQIRAEFLDRSEKIHTAPVIVAEVHDFNFTRIIKHLRAKQAGRMAVPGLTVVVRQHLTVASVELDRLLAWTTFVRGTSFSTVHLLRGLPAVAQRRTLMGTLLQLKVDVGAQIPEITMLVDGFMKEWTTGEGIMKWVKEGETDPVERR